MTIPNELAQTWLSREGWTDDDVKEMLHKGEKAESSKDMTKTESKKSIRKTMMQRFKKLGKKVHKSQREQFMIMKFFSTCPDETLPYRRMNFMLRNPVML